MFKSLSVSVDEGPLFSTRILSITSFPVESLKPEDSDVTPYLYIFVAQLNISISLTSSSCKTFSRFLFSINCITLPPAICPIKPLSSVIYNSVNVNFPLPLFTTNLSDIGLLDTLSKCKSISVLK